ncbi:MAG: ATP-grasp domain-containing protein [Clostridiales bacterium]|nr:ATP-grasp domain-containing protein [Clostridiales bacterium]
MKAWLIYYKESAIYNEAYINFYVEEGNKLGIEVKLILVEDLEFGVKENKLFIRYQGEIITKPDFAICRAIYPLLSKHLEYMGIPTFNNSFVAEICNDKAKTYQYLAKTGIRMVDTSFHQNAQGRDVLIKAVKPTVIKSVDGHGGKQVFLYEPKLEELNPNMAGTANSTKHQNSDLELDKIIQGLGTSDLVVQPLTGSRHQDLRVYVIGKEVQAAVLRTAKNGFKSNFSLGGEVELYTLSEVEKGIINTIVDQFEFGLVGIDFIIGDNGELIFNEIEDVVGSRMLYQCSDINIVKKYLEYIAKRLS